MKEGLLRLNNVRASFVFVDEQSVYKGEKIGYKIHLLVKKGSEYDKAIRAKIDEVSKAAWGAKAPTILKSIVGNNMKYVYQPGELKGYDDDVMYLSCSNKKQPRRITKDKRVVPNGEKSDIYSGCYVDALVSIFATGSQGIAAEISGVMFVDDGEAFCGGYVASAEDFGITFEDDPLGA